MKRKSGTTNVIAVVSVGEEKILIAVVPTTGGGRGLSAQVYYDLDFISTFNLVDFDGI
jgi:hypothetical protein